MFTNLHLVLLLLLAGSLQFRNFTFNYRKKAKKKSRKRSNIVQFGRWRDSFSSALCSILSQSTLFQPMTARVISELYYKLSQSTLFQPMTARVISELYYKLSQSMLFQPMTALVISELYYNVFWGISLLMIAAAYSTA